MMTTTEKTIEQLQVELAAFDEAYLQEHGVYPALCDLPEEQAAAAATKNTAELSNQTIWFRFDHEVAGQTITDIEARNEREYGLCNYHLNGQDFLYVVKRWPDDPDVWIVIG